MDSFDEEDEKVISLEGCWDEDISVEEIHEQVLEKLKEEMDELKERYRQLSSSPIATGQDMRILRKITSVRLKHDKLVANAKHIFDELYKLRGASNHTATPCSRLVWMNHVQGYFRCLNDMFHIDVSLSRISPGLFRSAKFTGTETPNTFHKKRRMTIILQKLIENEKVNKKTTFNSRMKKYCSENLTTIPKRFLDPSMGGTNGKGFPDRWLELMDEEFREYFSRSPDTVYRWYLLFAVIGTEKFLQRFDFNGLCPYCNYPFIVDKALKSGSQHTENKLSCKECMKEIDWTYFASSSEMSIMKNFLHPSTVNEVDEIVKLCSPTIKEETSIIEHKKPLTTTIRHKFIVEETDTDTAGTTNADTVDTTVSNPDHSRPTRKRGRRKEHDMDKLIHIARQQLKEKCPLYNEQAPVKFDEDGTDKNYDAKIKDSANNLLNELKNFQGVSLEKIPQGVAQSVDSYLCRVHKIPGKEEIRREPLSEKGERQTVSRRMVLEALRECGLSKWSSHISYIMATLWWCPYPRVEHEDEERMIVMMIKQREIFERIKDKFARKSNLSVHTAMGKLLSLCGYPYDDSDFKIWETQDSKKKQDMMWDECVKEFLE